MIRFHAFSKRYGALRAVESLDLEIGAGEVVALLGPNGSGKTTSLKAAPGLVSPTSGEVTARRAERRPSRERGRSSPSFRSASPSPTRCPDERCWSSIGPCGESRRRASTR